MGRQPAYQRKDVLDKASQVFLRNGFQRTTIKDITKATGLQPGSIYAAFENKNGLYTEVIEHYTKCQISILENCEEQSDTSLEAIKAFFKMTGDHIAQRTPAAHCLLVYGAFEIPENEKELRYYMQLKLQEIESHIYVLLVKAQENNEIVCDENPIELARFLMTLLFGHRVLAQLHASSETIDNTIDRVFEVLEYKNAEQKA
ncbi:MAG: TetR/AcrR family transcriptional regulator [Gammaproteobacteria bacterium]